MSLSEAEFIEKCAEFGVKIPTPPGGTPMTGAEIIAAINGTLGYNYWINGISSAIFVNDLSESSADLAPYVDVDGNWLIPDGFLVVINTDTQTGPSVIGRAFKVQGRAFFQPSVTGGSKGITMVDGSGIGSCVFLNDSSYAGGGLIVGDLTIISNDPVRTIYSCETDLGLFIYNGTFFGGSLPGFINAVNVQINANTAIYIQEGLKIGPDCTHFTMNGTNAAIYPVQCATGIDLSVYPSPGPRIVSVSNVVSHSAGGTGFFVIGGDDGSTRGQFSNCIQEDGLFIYSLVSSTFNANPYFSPNFNFDVLNYGKTQRIGELYYNGGPFAIPMTVNTWTDVSSAPIANGGLSNGIVNTENPGELLYLLPEPYFVTVTYHIEGSTAMNNDILFLGAFYQPNVGVYAEVVKGGYTVESRMEPPVPSTYVSTTLTYTLQMHAGDRFKPMLKNSVHSNTFTLRVLNVTAQVVSS